MANQKISHLRAKLEGGSVSETFDIYDENAIHETVNNLTTSTTGSAMDAAQGPAITTLINGLNTSLTNLNTSITNQINSETAARTSAERTLSARMDTFTNLPSGSTTGDAELIDARVGFNAETYSNAGAAIRNQSKRNKSEIESILSLNTLQINPKFTNQRGVSSTGEIFVHSRRIACEEFIDIRSSHHIYYNIASGYRIYGAFYSTATGSSFVENTGDWLTGSGTITLKNTYKFFRVCYASVDDTSTLTEANAGNVTLTRDSRFLNNSFKYNGPVTSTMDLNTCMSIGIYNLYGANVDVNRHYPLGLVSGGSLLVFNAYGTMSTVLEESQLMQVVISNADKSVWARHCSTDYEWRDWVQLVRPVAAGIGDVVETTKWLAIGDSITYGVYSDSQGSHSSPADGWVTKLSSALNYNITNQGVRGMGYIAVGSNNVTFENTLRTVEGYSSDAYNLVTVALGINDYNTSGVTMESLEIVIKDSIVRLSTKFPKARLVYITPFNSNRRGDATTKYCFNFSYAGRSLKDIADLIKSCCDEYGVECIYASDGFLMNTYNMSTLLPDQTHPSQYCHTLIAKSIAHYLLF